MATLRAPAIRFVARLIGALIFLRAASSTQAQYAANDSIVATKDTAYLLLPPEVVSGGLVVNAKWSTDGNYVLIQRTLLAKPEILITAMTGQAPPTGDDLGRIETAVFNCRTHRLSSLYTTSMSAGVPDINWMNGAPIALFVVNKVSSAGEEGWTLVALDAARGVTRKIDEGLGSAPNLSFSPVAPIVVLTTDSSARVVGPSLQISPPIQYTGDGFPAATVFDEAGTAFLIRFTPAQPPNKRQKIYSRLNFASGQTQDVEAIDEYQPNEDKGDLRLDFLTQPINSGFSRTTAHTISLTAKDAAKDSPMPSAVVAVDGRSAAISPKKDAVLYISQECAFIRPLVKVPVQVMIDQILAAQRSVAVSNSKQAALAAIMYASDNNDRYPDPGQFYDQAMPYLKNAAILNSFVYTFAGGDMKDIAKPAETEIGYVPGPGGRAVAYADGHVKWIKD